MARGKLRIYLGAAPGVGKTYAMLREGGRRHERGTDVVVAYVETHGRRQTAAQVADLEVIPRKHYEYRGSTFEEMDLDAVLERRPQVALVDELAHTNTPGLAHEKRWQDVETLLEAGIDVISTVNVQHLESLNDVVEHITGVRQQETVPDVVVRRAEQVELVDMTPEALRRRMAHGNVYGPEKVDAALTNYFRPGNLAALRELALLWVADRVDESLQAYLEAHGIAGTWETRERIVVAVTGAPGGAELIRRAARMAARTRGQLLGVHVASTSGLVTAKGQLERHRDLLLDLGGTYHEIVGDNIGQALATFARTERATQLVLGASRRSRMQRLLHGDVIDRVLRDTGGIDVHVIETPATPDDGDSPRRPRRARWPQGLRSGLPVRRQVVGCVLGLLILAAATVAFTSIRSHIELSTVVLGFLAIVIVTTATSGPVAGITVAAVAFLLENYYFVEPTHTFTVANPEAGISLLGFLAFAVVASLAANRLARRNREAERARMEANALARSSATLVADNDSLAFLLDDLRATFQLDSVTLLARDGTGWRALAASGQGAAAGPDDGDTEEVDEETVLVLSGARLEPDERQLVAAFADQAAAVLEARRLRREAADASELVHGGALRAELLQSVCHDLQARLAGVQASVTTLRRDQGTWTPAAADERLAVIDDCCARLTRLVGNLLDAGRLQAKAVQVERLAVAPQDVLAAALDAVPGATDPRRLRIELPGDLPLASTDPGLFERVLADVIANALTRSPPDKVVRVSGDAVNDHVVLLVVDQGTTLPAAPREAAPGSDRRLPEGSLAPGVGIGLAVARANMELLGGQLIAEDTPGGGLTVTITVAKARASTLASNDDGGTAAGPPAPPAQLGSDPAGAATEAHARSADHSQTEA